MRSLLFGRGALRRVTRAALVLALAPAALSRAADPLPDDCMPLSEIRVGMTGEARSVVSGFDPVAYKVEILGVEQGGLTGSAMILARLEGPSLEKHGIVAGMSGSPVFINGKCIGAVAYGWSYSYNPIAGITPIESMLTVWDELDNPEPPRKSRRGGSGAAMGAGASASVSTRGWDWRPAFQAYMNPGVSAEPQTVRLTPSSPKVVEAMGEAPVEMIPLSAPVCVSTASRQTGELLGKFFASRGIEMNAAGSSAGSVERPETPSPDMIGGSGIAIPLMTGDLTIASVGTVTYRKGPKLLAFGHPMFFEGLSDAPMANAYIFGYMQSYNRSFKLAESREIVGSVRQDRMFCIGGVFGAQPERIDMNVRVGGKAAVNPRDYKFSIWESEQFSPMLSGTALSESFLTSCSDGGELTARCDYTVELARGEKISKSLITSARGGAAFDFMLALAQDLFLLEINPYEQIDLKSINAEISIDPGFSSEALQKAAPRRYAVEPGETVGLNLTWLPFRGDERAQQSEIKIPDDVREGSYVVHIADAETARRIDQRREPGSWFPRNTEEIIDLTRRLDYPANRLTVYVIEPEVGVGVYSAGLSGAPASVTETLASSIPEEAQSMVVGRIVSRANLEYDHPVSGAATFALDVKHFISE